MTRLPTPGSDDGTWGTILNQFLQVEHNSDGTLKNVARPSDLMNANKLQGVALSSTAPTNGQVLKFNGTSWAPGTDNAGTPGTTLPTDAAGWLHDDGTGTLAWSTPAKADVGLGNVDNTSDVNKPVSTATQTALNAKADASALTAHTSATTSVHGIADTSQLATQTDLASKASDASVVHNTGNETVAGVKTFSSAPVFNALPTSSATPLSGSQLTTKTYVDAAANSANAVKLQGTTVDGSAPTDGQLLVYSATSSSWVPNTASTTTVSDATTTTKGIVQLAGDLGGVASGPSVTGVNGVAVSGTPTTGQVLTATSGTAATWQAVPAGTTLPTDAAGWLHDDGTGTLAWSTPAKADVGLGNVDNTSDVNKPVSTATQTALNAKANTSTTITAGTGLAGGGDLSANRTLSVTNDSTTQRIEVAKGGTLTGTRKRLNFIAGANVTVTTADDATNNKVDVTIAATSGGSGYTFNVVSFAPAVGGSGAITANAFDFIFADSTNVAIDVTLPAPTLNAVVRVKRPNPAGNYVQIHAPTGSYIDGSSVGTDTLNGQYYSQDYWSDGSNWFRV